MDTYKDTIIYIDMDGVMCNYAKGYAEGLKRNPHQPYPQSEFGFFTRLEPVEDAIETINWLREKFTVYALTRPSVKNIMCYSEKAAWIRDHFDDEMLENLIICCNKSLVKGDFLIDDMTDHGQTEFEGIHLHFGTTDFPNWKEIKEYFEEVLEEEYDF